MNTAASGAAVTCSNGVMNSDVREDNRSGAGERKICVMCLLYDMEQKVECMIKETGHA